jgi:catechol 2,3-dioxygenase-like lactoylglutathione lyase family enzyme
MTVTAYTHLGVTVADLDIAKRYFITGLGFEPVRSRTEVTGELARAVAKLWEFDEFEARMEFVERDRQVLGLVEYHKPAPIADQRQPMNICSSSHLCFLVQDIDEVARSLEKLGGSTLHDTRISTDLPDGKPRTYMLCLTPDGGTRIELIETDGLPNS